MVLKKCTFGLMGIFFLLLSSGCNGIKEETKKNTYNDASVTLNNIEVATISKIVNSKKEIVTNSVNDEIVRLVYEKNSITDDEYEKYVGYFYDECYGFTSLMGSISADGENYIEFVKKFDNKLMTIIIDETVSNGDSQYSMTYQIRDFDENVDEIYYNKEITIIEDGEPTYKIVKNDKCN